MTYDITGHSLLTEQAEILTPTERTAQVEAAEDLLGLMDTEHEGKDERLARLALVYQVNHQLSAGPDAEVIRREVKGDVTRELKRSGISLVSSRAERILTQIESKDAAPETPTPTRRRSTSVPTYTSW